MTQLTLQWNEAIVHDLLHYPQRLLNHADWSMVIAEAGGLTTMRQQLLKFPLKAKERRVLEVILTNPDASVVRYTELLAMHHATFHRQKNALCRSLSQFLDSRNTSIEAKLPIAVTTELPQQQLTLPWTSFIGRDRDRLQLLTLLKTGCRWITLVGTGGVGKTRLALELANQCIGQVCDEVHVLRFADVQHVNEIGRAAIQQLQLHPDPDQPIEQVIQAYFANRRSLVILDNLEHLPNAAAWFDSIFQPLPQQQIVTTSRIRLNVADEHVYTVEALAYPQTTTPASAFERYPAIELCLDRMEAVRLVDRTDAQLMAAVATICRHVAGLPLAIELVAARADQYSLSEIVRAIQADLGFLSEGPLDVETRQQTMEATVAWSYRLLPKQSQQIFSQLAVFQAGWDVAAAAALCKLDPALMEDHLVFLCDNHLINYRSEINYQPYTILEPIRQYAWQLSTLAEQQRLRLRHCDYYITWVAPTEDLLIGPDHPIWGRSMLQAYANIQLAVHTAKSIADIRRFWQLLGTLYRFWWDFQFVTEAQSWIEPEIPRLLQHSTEPYLQCRVLYASLLFCSKENDEYKRSYAYEYLINLTQQHQFPMLEAKAKNFYALILMEQNKLHQASDLLLEAINLYRAIDAENNMLSPMFNYANLMYKMKKLDQAYAMYQELVVKFEKIEDYDGMFSSIKNMSVIFICQGKYHEAEAMIFDIIERSENKKEIPLYLRDFNLYLRLIKIYYFLQQEQKIDWCVHKLYPIALENVFFMEQVFAICEAMIYLAIAKGYEIIGLDIYRYLLTIIHCQKYEMRWYETEFLAQTQIVLMGYYDTFDFIIDDDFVLECAHFNNTINYYLKLIYRFN